MLFSGASFCVGLGDKKLNKRVSVIIAKYIVELKNLLREGVESGELRNNLDLEGTALLLFGMIQGLVNIWTLSNYEINLETSYESSWNTLKECIKRI